MRKKVRADLEQPGRVLELMDLIKNDNRAIAVSVKKLWMADHVFHNRKIAVHVESPIITQTQGEGCFPDAPNSGEPGYRSLSPGFFKTFEPERAWYHVTIIIICSDYLSSMINKNLFLNRAIFEKRDLNVLYNIGTSISPLVWKLRKIGANGNIKDLAHASLAQIDFGFFG
jgi:hypothetical protein